MSPPKKNYKINLRAKIKVLHKDINVFYSLARNQIIHFQVKGNIY